MFPVFLTFNRFFLLFRRLHSDEFDELLGVDKSPSDFDDGTDYY